MKIDASLLSQVGLERLPANLKNCALSAVYSVLETRVGMRLASRMTKAQLEEFEVFYQQKDDAGALAWLETAIPDYRAIVGEEYRSIVEELSRAAKWLSVVAGT